MNNEGHAQESGAWPPKITEIWKQAQYVVLFGEVANENSWNKEEVRIGFGDYWNIKPVFFSEYDHEIKLLYFDSYDMTYMEGIST